MPTRKARAPRLKTSVQAKILLSNNKWRTYIDDEFNNYISSHNFITVIIHSLVRYILVIKISENSVRKHALLAS
jgi:hypothetical protein